VALQKRVVLLHSKDGKEIRSYKHSSYIYTCRWHPNGNEITSGGADKLIDIWDSTTMEKRNSHIGHALEVHFFIIYYRYIVVAGVQMEMK